MSYRYQSSLWSVELRVDWIPEDHGDHIVIRLPRPGAELRFTTFDPTPADLTAARWVETCARFDRLKGRPIIPRRYGAFAGHETWYETAGVWVRGWALAAGDFLLDVNYRCDRTEAHEDSQALDALLMTLQFHSAAV
jgi:hypothetical protein